MTKLATLLGQIDTGSILLPEFQRGYVWNRDQIRGLFRSLYLEYPVGGLLVWETETTEDDVRGTDEVAGLKTLLLDGQQRMTTLYSVMRGQPPRFFEGDSNLFKGLRFNVEDEIFEFYTPAKMRDDARWVNVTEVFGPQGVVPYFAVFADKYPSELQVKFVERLNKLANIAQRDFHVEKIVGEDKDIDTVVDIFNRVNSGGTKLSKGDLALARISAQAPELRNKMRTELNKWNESGYKFELDWYLRNINAVATGRSQFSYLDDISMGEFQQAITSTTKSINLLLNLIASRLGLDHNQVLMGRYSFPVLVMYLTSLKKSAPTKEEIDKALFWYIHASLWGRYSGSTESVLASDYEILKSSGMDGLIKAIETSRGGNLQIMPNDFISTTLGSRFYPLLYLLTRTGSAQDLLTGITLQKHLLGNLSNLQVHHIFPKKVLKDNGYSRGDINAIANFCFLTQESNLIISKREPKDYFAEVIRLAGEEALTSQWIPLNSSLWEIDRYQDFLQARRELLAAAANEFLDSLFTGSAEELALPHAGAPEDEDGRERRIQIETLLNEISEYGVVEPEFDVEIRHPETGELITVAEAFWRTGLQPGLGEPVILELDRHEVDREKLEDLDVRVFYKTDKLKKYVQRLASVSSGESSA